MGVVSCPKLSEGLRSLGFHHRRGNQCGINTFLIKVFILLIKQKKNHHSTPTPHQQTIKSQNFLCTKKFGN